MGYTINEDGTVTRDNVPKKTYDTGTSNSTGNSNNGGDSGSGCIIWIIIAIVIGAIFVIANTNKSNSMSQVYLNVSPINATFPSSGGSENIHIDTNSEWSISVNTNSWGHLTRHGNQLILKVDQNTSSSQRTDYFKIKAGNIERTINITQAAVSNSSYNSNRVTGSIRNIWVDHNVTDSYGNYGMRIHVKFDINGMLNRTGLVAAYFYNSNGNALRDTNSSYRTTDGNVATHVNFTPNYENCTFNDLSIFMPYSELHLSRTTSCYFTISIWNGNNEVAQSERNSFHLTY